MSPIPSSAAKKPGILAWIGFIALAAIILIVVLSILAGFMSKETSTATDTLYFRGESGGVGMMNVVATQSAPPMAPSYLADNSIAMVSEEVKRAGSAAPTEDGDVQRVIKTGEISLRVADAPKAVEDIKSMVTGKGGFVESSSVADSGTGPRNAWMTIRVPVASFDATMKDLKGFGTLTLNESVHGQDVTEEFVDLDADIRNARAEEASYLEILKRTGSIEDILNVTRQLADVRGRIERLEGRKRYLENRTDLATISVSLTEETRIELPSRSWKPFEVLKSALRDLVESLQGLVDFLIRLVIGLIGLLLPVALLTFLIMWLGWKIIKTVIRRFRR